MVTYQVCHQKEQTETCDEDGIFALFGPSGQWNQNMTVSTANFQIRKKRLHSNIDDGFYKIKILEGRYIVKLPAFLIHHLDGNHQDVVQLQEGVVKEQYRDILDNFTVKNYGDLELLTSGIL